MCKCVHPQFTYWLILVKSSLLNCVLSNDSNYTFVSCCILTKVNVFLHCRFLSVHPALEAKTREENTKAYDEWIVQKELRDSALKCLALVPRPVAEMPVLHDDVRGSATNLKKSASAGLGEYKFLTCQCISCSSC